MTLTAATQRSIDTSRNRAVAREAARVWNQQVPVVFEPGSAAAPKVTEGRAGGWFTKSGEPITYPGAYGRRGWSNMEYHTDTRVVTVGVEWDGLEWE